MLNCTRLCELRILLIVALALVTIQSWSQENRGGAILRSTARLVNVNLVVTDIDMPRMDGIELVTLINKDANLRSVPVMIVSYKDRDEDRQRGLEAGAAYYLTKGSFHDETLLQAVVDLIGEPEA